MSIEIVEQALPFDIPEPLRQLLETNVQEYGTGGGIGAQLPCTRAWIAQRGSEVVGYAWISERQLMSNQRANYFSQAVLPAARNQGIGQEVRRAVELLLRLEGVATLYVQVNSNDADTGLRVRRRLLRSGYAIDRSQVDEDYVRKGYPPASAQCDFDLCLSYIIPLHFRKPL